jgi:hypothetical protein
LDFEIAAAVVDVRESRVLVAFEALVQLRHMLAICARHAAVFCRPRRLQPCRGESRAVDTESQSPWADPPLWVWLGKG